MQVCHASSHVPTFKNLLSFRLVEEVKELCDGVELENEDVYMATTFKDFIQLLVRKLRGDDKESECIIDYVSSGLPHMGMTLQTPQASTAMDPTEHTGVTWMYRKARPPKCPPFSVPSSPWQPWRTRGCQGSGTNSTEEIAV